nr:hypothetical protein [Paenibacillus lignilyticus]
MIKGVGGIFWRTKNLEAVKKWYGEVVWIADPDGRLIELWEK